MSAIGDYLIRILSYVHPSRFNEALSRIIEGECVACVLMECRKGA